MNKIFSRIRGVLIVYLLLAVFIPSPSMAIVSGEFDIIWKLNRKIDEGIKSKSKSISEPFRKDFEILMKKFFDEKLTPLIAQIDALVKSDMKYGEEIIQRTLVKIDESVDRVFSHAERLTSNTIEEFREEIIIFTFNEAEDFRQELFSEINSILDRASYLIEETDCRILGTIEGAQLYMSTFWDVFPRPLDVCAQAEGVAWQSRNSWTEMNHYRVKSCHIQSDLTIDLSVQQILDKYISLQKLAAEFGCLHRSAPDASRIFTEEIMRFRRAFDTWYTVSRG